VSYETRSENAPCLSGCRVLIVEDDYYLAEDLSRTLRLLGATILTPTPSLAGARSLVRVLRPHCILLNIDLGGEDAIGFALEMRGLGVPVIFVTGHGIDRLSKAAADIPLLRKPLLTAALVQNIHRQLSCHEQH
jgi:DNA-binding response OmpR family regulator